jgi:hypothetical protein
MSRDKGAVCKALGLIPNTESRSYASSDCAQLFAQMDTILLDFSVLFDYTRITNIKPFLSISQLFFINKLRGE